MNLEWLPRDETPIGEAADIYAANDFAIFPTRRKEPLTRHGFKDARPDASPWKRQPDAQIAWALPARALVLDEDPRHGGQASRELLEHEHGPLPLTLRQVTGSGGFHWIYRAPANVVLSQRSIGDGLDTRLGGKGYVIVAPSVHHETGARYRWDSIIAPVDAPMWLVEALRVREAEQQPPIAQGAPSTLAQAISEARGRLWALRSLEREAHAIGVTSEGGRNAALNAAAYRFGRMVAGGLLDLEIVRVTLRAAGLAAGLPEPEVDRVLR